MGGEGKACELVTPKSTSLFCTLVTEVVESRVQGHWNLEMTFTNHGVNVYS